MPGMGTPAGAPAGFPALAVILALFLLGSVMWTTDQLAALARVTTSPAAPGQISAAARIGHRPTC